MQASQNSRWSRLRAMARRIDARVEYFYADYIRLRAANHLDEAEHAWHRYEIEVIRQGMVWNELCQEAGVAA